MEVRLNKFYFGLILMISFLSSCKKSDADSVADAQRCLDKSTSSTVNACLDYVQGIETEAAYLIRCSASFIFQDFTNPTRLSNIAEQMKNSGSSSSTVALGMLSFSKPTDVNQAASLANSTFQDCVKSKSKGMILLSAMANIASSANAAGVGDIVDKCDSTSPGYNATDCENATKDGICNASPATVGNATLIAYQQSCLGSNQQNSSVCTDFATATNGTTDPATIGANVQSQNGCP